MLLTVKSAVAEDEQAVVALWCACDLVASYNDPVADFRFAKASPCSDVLVAVDNAGEVAGSVMVGHDGHRGWLYYLAARRIRFAQHLLQQEPESFANRFASALLQCRAKRGDVRCEPM